MRTKFIRIAAVYALCAPLVSAECRADEALGRALNSVGWSAPAFAASGLTASDVTSLLQTMVGSAELAAVDSAQAALTSAEQNREQRLQEVNPLTPAGAAELVTANAAVATARSGLLAASEAFVASALAGRATASSDRLRVWRASSRDLPPGFRVVPFSPPQSRRIQRALRDELIAQASGGSLSGTSASVLAEARSRADVIAASAGLAQNLTEITNVVIQMTH
jgi:hypothetical protein